MTSSARIEEVQKWLKENVQSFSTPQKIIIDEIDFDWDDLSGGFSLQLDEIRVSERYSLSVGIDGRYEYGGPMYVSPLGAPASYRAISLTDETELAISNALNNFFPRMAAFGLHPITKEFINSSTPVRHRIVDHAAIEHLKQLIANHQARIEVSLN